MNLDTVEICENLSKEDIIKKFEEIKKLSDEFQETYKKDHQAVFGVFINWIGHFVDIKEYPDLLK